MEVQEQILAKIKQYDTIIVHRHKSPDPDALGSQGGLTEILRTSFPDKTIYKVGGPINDLGFMTTMDEVTDDVYKDALVIVTDTANAPRISDERYKLGRELIKIDHHPNDEPYGDLLWVNTNASSCSEIIASFVLLFPETLKFSEESARLLYGGIVGDTGRFLYPATTTATLNIAATLLSYGFDATKLNRELDQVPMKVAKLYGYFYEKLEVDENGAGFVILPQTIMQEYGVLDTETSSLVSLPGRIESVVAWGIFVEQPTGFYRARLRSKGPVINDVAKRHHGGGHPLASGANAKDLAEIKEIYREIQAKTADFVCTD